MIHTAAWGVSDFTAQLLAAANGALPYVGAGVAAGVVVFVVTFGIKKGLAALHTVAYDPWDGVVPIASDYEQDDPDY